MPQSTTIYRIVEVTPDGSMTHDWHPTAVGAKKDITAYRLNKFDCRLERMTMGTTAYDMARLINTNLHIVGVKPENRTTFQLKWVFPKTEEAN